MIVSSDKNFKFYSSGVLNYTTKKKSTDSYVVVVGYGTDPT